MFVSKFSLSPSGGFATRLVGDIPAIPLGYIDRTNVDPPIDNALCTKTKGPVGTALSVILGMPGAGKTVLAAFLARRCTESPNYRDGVFWLNLGAEPDLLGLVDGLIQELGDRNYVSRHPQAAAGHLKSILRNKRALVVLDDIWNAAHLTPFLVEDGRCRFLITTRQAAIAEIFRAPVYRVGVMTAGEAVRTIELQMGRTLDANERNWASELTRLTDGLPLALGLASAQLVDGVPWPELLNNLRVEIGRIDALDPQESKEWDPEIRRSRSLRACFEFSLNRQEAETVKCFIWLGVLRPGTVFSTATLKKMWGLSDAECSNHLKRLARQSLIAPVNINDCQEQSYRIHDLIHDFAKTLLVKPPTDELKGLGLAWSEAHSIFIQRNIPDDVLSSKRWSCIIDNGYILRNLGWHLEKAGRIPEMYGLVEAGQEWYETCDQNNNLAAFFSTIIDVKRVAKVQFERDACCLDLIILARCALLTSSISSIVDTTQELAPILLREGIWDADKALTLSRRQSDSNKRLKSLIKLISVLPPKMRELLSTELCDEICKIDYSNSTRFYELALEFAREISGETAIAERLLTKTRFYPVDPSWIRLWSILLPIADREFARQYADRSEPHIMEDRSWWNWACALLSPYAETSGQIRADSYAIECAKKITYPDHRAFALAQLTGISEPRQRQQLVEQGFDSIERSSYGGWGEFLNHLRPSLVVDPAIRSLAFGRVVNHFSRASAMDGDRAFVEFEFTAAVRALAQAPAFRPDPALIEKAVQVSRSFGARSQVAAVASIAKCIDGPERSTLAREAEKLCLLPEIDPATRSSMLLDVVDLLEPSARRELLVDAQRTSAAINDERSYFIAFIRLLEQIDPTNRKQVFSRVIGMDGNRDIMACCLKFAGYCAENSDRYNYKNRMKKMPYDVFVSLALLFEEQRDMLLSYAIERFDNPPDSLQISSITRIASNCMLTSTSIEAIEKFALGIQTPKSAVDVLGALMSKANLSRSKVLLHKALDLLVQIERRYDQKEALDHIIDGIWKNQELVSILLKRVTELGAPMAPIASLVSGTEAEDLYLMAAKIPNSEERLETMLELIPSLPPSLQEEKATELWQDILLSTHYVTLKSKALSCLVRFHSFDLRLERIKTIIEIASDSRDEDYVADAICRVAENVMLNDKSLEFLLECSRHLHDSQNAAGAMLSLLPHASFDVKDELFKEAVEHFRRAQKNDRWTLFFLQRITEFCPQVDKLDLVRELATRALGVGDRYYIQQAVRLLEFCSESEKTQLLPILFDILGEKKRSLVFSFITDASTVIFGGDRRSCIEAMNVAMADIVTRYP